MWLLSVNKPTGRPHPLQCQAEACSNRGCLWPGEQWHPQSGQTQRPTGLLGTTREQMQARQHRVSHIASSAFWEQVLRGSVPGISTGHETAHCSLVRFSMPTGFYLQEAGVMTVACQCSAKTLEFC